MADTSAASGAVSAPNLTGNTSLPSVEQRLADLRPSRELLEFYRQKIAEYDDEYMTLLKRFETLSSTQEDKRKVEEELKGREAEVHQLQKALSDIQVFLMQERENVVRLYAENDRLKLRQFEDSKKIQALLSLMGGDSSSGMGGGEMTYFHQEPPARAVVERVKPAGDHQDSCRIDTGRNVLSQSSMDPNVKGRGADKENRSKASLAPQSCRSRSNPATSRLEESERQTEAEVARLQIQALQAQLEEVTRTSREQIDVLVEDRRVGREESDARVQNIEVKMAEVSKKHDRIQELLQQTTQDLLDEKQSHRTAEREWMSEKDRLLRLLDEAHDRGYGSEDEAGEGRTEQEEQRVEVLDNAAGVDVGAAGHSMGVSASTSIQTELKQTADHGAQTLIPSLGALPPRPSRTYRGPAMRPSSRSVRVVDAMLEKREAQHQLEIQALQNQLIQANKLSELYRDQVIGVEGELSRLREEDSLNRTLFKERSDGVNRRLEQMKDKNAALEKRRLLEAEGYKTDIRLLRNRLKDAEKQIYKLTVSMPVSDGDDIAMLKEVKIGASRAKKAQGEVNLLKAKIYGIEHQLKKL